MTKKKWLAVALAFMLTLGITACGESDSSTFILDETHTEAPKTEEKPKEQEEQKDEEEQEKRVVNPITNGGNLDIGNGY